MTKMASQHAAEVASGERFPFGKNWAAFLAAVDETRIEEARRSLEHMLETQTLAGLNFLDIGCGSGLFSLAARRMGARVVSFDFDPDSVGCALELKRRYAPGDDGWQIRRGSLLDPQFLAELGQFDVVYCWGVLHHTGQMWRAAENCIQLVKPGGKLFVAIYNDQGAASRRWLLLKRAYNRYPLLRLPLLLASFWVLFWRPLLKDLLLLRPGHTFAAYRRNRRGMSLWRDLVDWVGGYPFEYAKPEAVFHFFRDRGFRLVRLATDRGLGCNEFVMVREDLAR